VPAIDSFAGEIDDRFCAIQLFGPITNGFAIPLQNRHRTAPRLGLPTQHGDFVITFQKLRN